MIAKKLMSNPAVAAQIFLAPPVFLHVVSLLMGSKWPIFYFLLGSITTIITEIVLILWLLHKPMQQELEENMVKEEE